MPLNMFTIQNWPFQLLLGSNFAFNDVHTGYATDFEHCPNKYLY